MNQVQRPIEERQLREIAATFSYPPTPDIAGRVHRQFARQPSTAGLSRRLAWAVLLLLLLAGMLLAVPSVRAALFDFFQIGAIRIVPDRPLSDTATAIPAGASVPAATATRTLLDVAGATTWEEAQAATTFPLNYPPGLGPPDAVYLQQLWDPGMDEPVVILVWLAEDRPDEVTVALYQIAVPYYGIKGASIAAITETKVHQQPAYWVGEPHRLRLQTGEIDEWFFVPGNVLLWAEGALTYRLEGASTVEEAVRIAESLSPQPERIP